MHASSLENMQKCYRRYIANSDLEKRIQLKVLDVGGADVNGSYSDIFNRQQTIYIGADLQPGEGVSLVLDNPDKLPLDDSSIDIVISGQMLEHCEFFWIAFAEMVRVVKDDGYIFLIAPSAGPIHRYPVDCYRFYPDAYRALAKYTKCHLIDVWHDNRGPWNDLVGVFNKSGVVPDINKHSDVAIALAANDAASIEETPFENTQGEDTYVEILRKLHSELIPQNYLEIGVRHGRSLSLASCKAVGIEPIPDLRFMLPQTTRIVTQTSDDFFEKASDPILQAKPDLVFIDGMHLVEYALRDFMNVEKICGPGTVVVIDDVFPNEPQQARRERQTRVWTGDVWKLSHLLAKYRPDLVLIPIDTSPTGLLMIVGLTPDNQTLWQYYNPIVREALYSLQEPPSDILNRKNAVSPSSDSFAQCINIIKNARLDGVALQSYAPKMRELLDNSPQNDN